MPVPADFAVEKLRRFAAFPGFPAKPDALFASARYLAEMSRSEADCGRITERLFESCRRFPLPIDIRAAAQDEHDQATSERCHECRDMGWVARGDRWLRCRCTGEAQNTLSPPEIEDAYARQSRVADLPDHPEAAIGIPNVVITAKPAFKEKYAKQCLYDGPLTLQAAIDAGQIAFAEAQRLVRRWEIAHREKFQPELQEPAKPKPAASEPAAARSFVS